jgi:hypothetical protein
MTIPEATPRAKLTAKILVQKRAMDSYRGSRVRKKRHSMATISTPNPMVRGGKR